MRIWAILLACQLASTSLPCNPNPFFDCSRHLFTLPLCIRSRSHTYRSGCRSGNVLLRWHALSHLLIAISRLLPQPSSVDSYLKSRLSNKEHPRIGYIRKYPTCLNTQFGITDIIDIWSENKKQCSCTFRPMNPLFICTSKNNLHTNYQEEWTLALNI